MALNLTIGNDPQRYEIDLDDLYTIVNRCHQDGRPVLIEPDGEGGLKLRYLKDYTTNEIQTDPKVKHP